MREVVHPHIERRALQLPSHLQRSVDSRQAATLTTALSLSLVRARTCARHSKKASASATSCSYMQVKIARTSAPAQFGHTDSALSEKP